MATNDAEKGETESEKGVSDLGTKNEVPLGKKLQ